ncbi:hypothetical protein [Nocardia sp. NBC_01327]|uniref:hypothetical protein n=1 Tax=Nocardia sp. NBC_01327 TaxID=2903593 RepID=UPI002E1059CD|nr:hypothetical protein OG326_41985 [Nocardia sp. NBC_01327]
MGFRLPTDYRDFIDLYGEGQINQELSVFFPAHRTGDRPSLTALLDRSRQLKSFGFYEAFGSDDGPARTGTPPNPGASESAELLVWGKTWNGDLFFWAPVGEDPDAWPISMHLPHLNAGDRWRRFDGGMAQFLTSVADGSFTDAARLIGGRPGPARWSRLRDWEYDYGKPPSAVFNAFDQVDGQGNPYGRQIRSGSPIPLCDYGHAGGDQAYFRSTGELRPLIGLDPTGTQIQLHGGSQAPGIAYFLYGTVDFGAEHIPGTVGVDMLRDGEPIASAMIDRTNPQHAHVAVEILVDADADAASVQLRVIADPTAIGITVENVYLRATGTLRTE